MGFSRVRHPIEYGKYLLLERISVGGMAEVFKAKAYGVEGFQKILAIKRILPSMAEDADFIQMFIDEAKIAGQLTHANICQIFELGKQDDSHFIAMEYIWGRDLLQIQNRYRRLAQPMPVALSCYVALKVCEGLDYAHRRADPMGRPLDIIHRDVSPQNVLVSYDGEIKLIDFGIAKAAFRASKTQAGVLKGKFGYMSPEQVRGLPLDRRSDVFSIGTILYEMLTGDRLFVGESDFATLEKVRNVEVGPPSQLNPEVSARLDALVLRALARDAEERYQWANELQEELQGLLISMEPVFTAKDLGDAMRQLFGAEVQREQQLLERYRNLSREEALAEVARAGGAPRGGAGRREGVATHVGAPPEGDAPFDDGDTRIDDEVRPSPPIAARAVAAAGEFDDGPTEIFAGGDPPGALGAEPSVEVRGLAAPKELPLSSQETVILDGAAASAARAAAVPAAAPVVSAPVVSAPVVSVPVAPAPGASSPVAPLRAGPSAQGAAAILAGIATMPPTRGPALSAPVAAPAPPRPPSVARAAAVTTGAVDVRAPARRSLAPQIAIGGAIGVAVLLVIAAGLRLWARPPPTATLVVTVSPAREAAVLLDGRSAGRVGVGASALTLKGVAPGSHQIVLSGPGAHDFAQTITLAAGDVGVVAATLRTLDEPGKLRLEVTPPTAEIFLDGSQVTPEADGSLAVRGGVAHELRVVASGFGEEVFRLEVPAGSELRRVVALRPARLRLEITSEPPGATVNVDGRPQGQTPLQLEGLDPAVAHRVSVRKAGFVPVYRNVAAQPDRAGAVRIDARLEQAAGEPESDAEPAAPAGADVGYLIANTQPWARVFIDGKDSGKTTPIAPRSKIPLRPGKHRVTFAVGGSRFDFDVVIRAGEDATLIRKLEVEPGELRQ